MVILLFLFIFPIAIEIETVITLKSAKFLKLYLEMEWVDLWQFHVLSLKTLMVRHGGSSASSYLDNSTSTIPSLCAVIALFESVPVHQLSWLAL